MYQPRVITVTFNPAIDKTLIIPGFAKEKINRVRSEHMQAGGKGVNVASLLGDFGFVVEATGFLGKVNAKIFEELLQKKKITNRFIYTNGETRTNLKIVDPSLQQTTDINFSGLQPTRKDVDKLLQLLNDISSGGTWFIVSGSLPQGVDTKIYRDLIHSVTSRGGIVSLDTSGEALQYALDATPHLIKPNLQELQDFFMRTLKTKEEILQAGKDLLARGIKIVVISCGASGAFFLENSKAIFAGPPKVCVKSTFGAGDAMLSGMVVAKLRGLSLVESARLATACAAMAISHTDPEVPREDVIDKFVNGVTISPEYTW
ncbi:MAG: 1-phosphofructokinase [Spirochaetota bacterium]